MDENKGIAWRDYRGPWGPWATAGWTVLIIVGIFVVQIIQLIVFLSIDMARTGQLVLRPTIEQATALEQSGVFIAVLIPLSAIFVILAIWLLIRLRRGLPLREYLALRRATLGQFIRWTLLLLAVMLLMGWVMSLLGRDELPESNLNWWRTAGWALPLLVLSIVVIAPIYEELLFRGFIFKGLEHSRLGADGAIIISALSWTLIHFQYDRPEHLVYIFMIGLVIGYSRARSGSIYVPIALHVFNNLLVVVQLDHLTRVGGG